MTLSSFARVKVLSPMGPVPHGEDGAGHPEAKGRRQDGQKGGPGGGGGRPIELGGRQWLPGSYASTVGFSGGGRLRPPGLENPTMSLVSTCERIPTGPNMRHSTSEWRVSTWRS